MALFGTESTSLEKVLGDQANNQAGQIQDAYAQKRKRTVASEAHAGRLGSGVSDYTMGDLNAAEAGDVGDVYSGLASSLGAIPAEDYTNANSYNRNLQLAQLIGSLNKPSSLQEALGMLGQAGNIGAKFAAFA